MKINVDAYLVTGAHSFSVGMIIRNHIGQFIQAKNLRYAGEVPVFEAEVRGVLEAMLWLQSL